MKKMCLILMLLLLALSVMTIPTQATGKIWHVDDDLVQYPNADFTTQYGIREAVAAASDGDIILVHAGTYKGQILVDKSLKLIAVDSDTNVGYARYGFRVTANDVTISGFTIDRIGMDYCIWIEFSEGSEVIGNKIVRCWAVIDGIFMKGSTNNMISGNEIAVSDVSYGIRLIDSDRNKIFGNNMCSKRGVYLENSNDNKIIGNKAEAQYIGLLWGMTLLGYSNNNKVLLNDVQGFEYDLYQDETCLGNLWKQNTYETSYGI